MRCSRVVEVRELVAHWSFTVPPALKAGLSFLQSVRDWVKKRLQAGCVPKKW